MVVCMRDHEVFDDGAFNNATGNNLSLNLTSEASSLKSLRELMEMATTEQLLRFTPKVEEVLDECQLRQATDGDVGLETFDGKECFARMFIEKFLSNTDVCFRFFFPFPNGIVWYNEVAFDPSGSRVMRSITLNKELFENVTTFKIFFTFAPDYTFKRTDPSCGCRPWLRSQEQQELVQSLRSQIQFGKQ